jgi:hypothetical protein
VNSLSKGLVSVVVCTYNRADALDRCLQSLIKQSYTNLEIIVVNGPSTDQTPYILAQYPVVQIINQKELNGLACARNLGIQNSRGEIVAFIDDDAIAEERWIEKLIRGYSSELVGGVGGLVLYPDKERVQFDNGIINKSGIPVAVRPKKAPGKGKTELPILMGTNCSFKRDALYNVGGFDPYFKYYHDESDLCVRLHLRGYKIAFIRDAIVFHEMAEGHNRRSTSDMNWTEIVKNSIYFSLKNFGGEIPSYIIRPFFSLSWWFIVVHYHFIHGNISLRELLKDYQKILKGALSGYKDGVLFNLHKIDRFESFLVYSSLEKP